MLWFLGLRFSRARARAPGPKIGSGPGPGSGPLANLGARCPGPGPGKQNNSAHVSVTQRFTNTCMFGFLRILGVPINFGFGLNATAQTMLLGANLAVSLQPSDSER